MVPRRRRFIAPSQKYLRTLYEGKGIAASPRFRWGLLAVLLLGYAANFFGGDRGWFRRRALERDVNAVVAANAALRLEKERLLQEVRLKEDDPFSLEKLAREKYWMVGPGESIYRFEDDEVVPEVEVEFKDAVQEGDDEEEGWVLEP